METGSTALKTALDGVKTSIDSSIGDALPVAGAVFATIAGIMLGFKFFKKLTGARS